MSGLRRLAEDDPHFAKFVTVARELRPRPEVLQGLLQKLPSPAVGGLPAPPRAPSKVRWWVALAGAGGCVLAGLTTFELSRESAPSAQSASPAQPVSGATGASMPGRSSPDDAREGAGDANGADVAVDAVPSIRVDDLPIAPSSEPSIRREAPATSSAQPKSLGREIELISAAREALTRGDPAACIAAVRTHEIEFPNGQFTLEARAMRVEATAARGDRKRAGELARAFLANHPHSPYEERMRSLLSSLETK